MKLGIIGDIHEDILRLKEAFHMLDRLGCDEVACLGDIAGFSIPSFGHFESRDASACLELVRRNCRYIVAGNHDLFPARRIPSFTAGFNYPGNWYELDHADRRKLAGETVWLNEENELDTLLSADEKAFIRTLPEYLVVEAGSERILLSHYLYPDLSGSTRTYYEAFGPVEDHLDFIEQNQCRYGFSGHKHIEGVYIADRSSLLHHDFGSHRLGKQTHWIVGPCIANGKKKNGCMIFDTETFILKVIPLGTPTRVMQVADYIET